MRLIEIPEDGIIRIPIMNGDNTVGEKRIDLSHLPTVDAVLKGLFEQYKWERDIAIKQLEELGLSFGQKIDGVYLTREEYDKLLEYKLMYEDLCN